MTKDCIRPDNKSQLTWDMTFDECLEGLTDMGNAQYLDTQRLIYWLGMAVETIGSLYWNDEKELAAKLIDATCAASERVNDEQINSYPDITTTLLRCNLCRPSEKIDITVTRRLYSALPSQPSALMLNTYVNYQCLFGLTNVLQQWKKSFESLKVDLQWHPYNIEQINIGYDYVSQRLTAKESVDINVDDFVQFINEQVEEPSLSDFIPWLHWYCDQNL